MKFLSPFLAIALLTSYSALAAAANSAEPVESNNNSLEAQPEVNVFFDEAAYLRNDPNDWLHQFDLVVVINKNRELWDVNKGSGNETIDIYRDGKLALRSWVSSGRETPEHANPDNPEAPQEDYFSQTNTGFYVPQRMDIDHVSGLYLDAFMPWAVFFNGGTATHRSPLEDLSKGKVDKFIGYRNSGGCVRLHEGVAKQLFWWVRNTGGPFTQDELANPHFAKEAKEQTAAGNGPRYTTRSQVMPAFAVDGTYTGKTQKMPYKTLYIVENVPVVETAETVNERGTRLAYAKKTFRAYQLPTGKVSVQPVDLSSAVFVAAMDPASLPPGNIPPEAIPQLGGNETAQIPGQPQLANYGNGFGPPPPAGYYQQPPPPPPGYMFGRGGPQRCVFIFCRPY